MLFIGHLEFITKQHNIISASDITNTSTIITARTGPSYDYARVEVRYRLTVAPSLRPYIKHKIYMYSSSILIVLQFSSIVSPDLPGQEGEATAVGSFLIQH